MCDWCPKGKFQEEGGQSSCEACTEGHYCPKGSSMTLPAKCAPGTFVDTSMLAGGDAFSLDMCKGCEPGYEVMMGAE